MKISVDDIELYSLNSTKEKVIKYDVSEDIFEEDMKRRLVWVLMHKWENCFKALKEEWEPKLAERGVQSIPLDPDAFAELVFAQPDYMDKKMYDQTIKQES